MSYRGNGYNNNNLYNNRNANAGKFVNNTGIEVQIMGWNGASLQECIGFILRKCKVTITNAEVDPSNGVLRGYVRDEGQVGTLMHWNGVKFAGQSLKFTRPQGGDSFSNKLAGAAAPLNGPTSTIGALGDFLKSRYNPEIKLLNLSNVKQDPSINSGGFFSNNSTSSKFFPALMKVAGDLKLDVVSIDLSGNELTDLTTVSALPQTFPQLQNLSLQNNKFTRMRSFDIWKNKLNFVREILLFGNQVISQVAPQDVPQIKLEFMKIFPRLVVLNGEILRNEQVLIRNLTLPFDTPKHMFFQDEEIQNLSTGFITNYLKLWDTNRAELMVLYQAQSQFSMQVDISHPHLIEVSYSHNSYNSANTGTDFGYYLPLSRNLTKVSSLKIRNSRVGLGQEQIFKLFSQLPKTTHDIMNKPELFSIESFRYPALNGILITLHGTFEETGEPEDTTTLTSSFQVRGRFNHSKGKKIALAKKSFDRTFVVIPGPNGSFTVASDLLSIKPFSGVDSWNIKRKLEPIPAAAPVNPGIPVNPHQVPPVISINQPTAADLPPEIKANLDPIKQELLVKVLLETKLTLQYGIMLCEQSNWDYQLCGVNFKNSVATLPREAYSS